MRYLELTVRETIIYRYNVAVPDDMSDGAVEDMFWATEVHTVIPHHSYMEDSVLQVWPVEPNPSAVFYPLDDDAGPCST